MNTRKTLFAAALSLAVAIAGLSWWAGKPAGAAEPWSTAVVPITGTVIGQPESVAFSGLARINSRLAPDPDFNAPRLVLSIDLTGVSGVGLSTTAKYAISGPEIVQRPLAATHLVDVIFPFESSTATHAVTARSGVASFALTVDVNTGAVTAPETTVATPNL